MATSYSNPYPGVIIIKGGLDAVIGASSLLTEDLLIDAIQSWAFLYFSYPQTGAPLAPTYVLDEMEFRSICWIAKNAFINNECTVVSPAQGAFIDLLINQLKSVPPFEISGYIDDIEDKIGESNLSMKEKMPLYFATAIGRAIYAYWKDQIYPSTTSPWSSYLDANAAINVANLSTWVAAAMQAALYFEFKGDYTSDPLRPPKMAGPDFVTAIVASIMVSAGKMIFKWMPRVKVSQMCNDGNLYFKKPIV